ncbi:carbohydrate esterase family 16 protein [Moniliophthora roreri]|nr:carbohydrate esterase family 16 protein [Moniliophthora roreri]
MLYRSTGLLLGLFMTAQVTAKLTWGNTRYLFVFGDSYTTTGYNISAGIDSPVPGFTSSNGPNWVQALGERYNVTNTKVFDLASGGATIDSALVPPYLPTVLSIVDQVNQFKTFLAPKPASAAWSSNDSLFAFWIGINDVGNSFPWTNVTQPLFYHKLMDRLRTQLEDLYTAGARSFLFLTVPPTDRAPLFIEQGPEVVNRLRPLVAAYNNDLKAMVKAFQKRHEDLDLVIVFDTQKVFNALLDNAEAFGFANATGYCEAYASGTQGLTTQVEGCAPVSSYFWLNSLHPLFTVHDILAKTISTTLST